MDSKMKNMSSPLANISQAGGGTADTLRQETAFGAI